MFPYVNIFGYMLPSYGLMGVVGALAAMLYLLLTNRGGRVGRLRGDDLLHIGCLAIVGALIGAKLLSIITMLPVIIGNWQVIADSPGLLASLLFTGYVFYGGAIGGFLLVLWYCKKYHVPLKPVLAVATPAVPLFHVFGRIGCFLGGCCYGIYVPWGIAFPVNTLGGARPGVPLLPVQLIEAGCNLLLFIALAAAVRRMRRKWMVMPLYIVCYGVLRFTLEFFRGDGPRGVFLLSTSQWISLALVAAVAVLYFARWRKEAEETVVG